MNPPQISLNREVLFANKFIHSLVREKILALQKARLMNARLSNLVPSKFTRGKTAHEAILNP